MNSNEINGVINILKPPGMTSHDVVSFIRRTLKIKKAGHTGTLDPGVAGVLPVCLGKATRVIEYMSDDIKRYRAELTFGTCTDTQDGFGRVLAVKDASSLTQHMAEAAVLDLQGELWQIPPMVSALKYQGKKLYELAREGIEIERRPRRISIYEIRIIKASDFGSPAPRLIFDVSCSKGTYIRTICHDTGEKLGFGGFMSFLVRSGTGIFDISEALTLEEVTQLAHKEKIAEKILPTDGALPMTAVWVDDSAVRFIQCGNRFNLSKVQASPHDLSDNQLVKLMNSKQGLLAVGRVLNLESSAGQPVGCTSLDNRSICAIQPVKVFC